MRIGFIHNAFPVLSQTFISKEMTGLQKRGLDIKIYSLFKPHPQRQANGSITSDIPITYVLPQLSIVNLLTEHLKLLSLSPMRYLSTLSYALISRENPALFIKTLYRFFCSKKMTKTERQDILFHFFLAVPLASRMRKDSVTLINSHFADAAASFALLCAKLLNLPYGITAHAYDIFTPQYNLYDKFFNAEYILTCTQFNKSFFLNRFPEFNPDKFLVFYHGINTEKFKPNPQSENKENSFNILSIGRLVNKKGFSILMGACHYLHNQEIPFKCRIIGDGPLLQPLTDLVKNLKLESKVELTGAVPHEQIKKYYEQAHIFVLPCIVDQDGNRDGIPNVLAEAMSMQIPVISTPISGIPELVIDNRTGLLAESENIHDLADKILSLYKDKKRRQNLGLLGREYVIRHFNSEKCLDQLADFYNNLDL